MKQKPQPNGARRRKSAGAGPTRPKSDRPRAKKRRALSTASAGGKTASGGDVELGRALVAALSAPASDRELFESATHPVHPYAARMHPATAQALVELGQKHARPGRRRLAVLDPFCGGGTVLVEARHAGCAATGVDLNPLAVAIARAKTWTAKPARIAELGEQADRIAARVIAEGKAARRSGHTQRPLYSPPGALAEARNAALSGWFAPHVRRELEHLAAEIDAVVGRDVEIGRALRVALSAILYKVSRRESETSPDKIERSVGRGQAARLFKQRARMLAAGLEDLTAACDAPIPRVVVGDARDLDAAGVRSGSVHAVITSPPYAGTYDYAAHHDLRLAFFGLDAQPLIRGELGARRQMAHGAGAISLESFGRDLERVFAEIARVLAPGGLAAMMMGDSLAGHGREAVAVRGDHVLRRAAKPHLSLVAWASQERPALGKAEARVFGSLPKREHVLLFARPQIRAS